MAYKTYSQSKLSSKRYNLTTVYSVAAAGAITSVNEGSSLTFNVTGSNIVDGTYYWTINNGTTSGGDFGISSGSFTITNNAGSFSVTPLADFTTEGAETFTVSVRTVSVSGTVVATSSSITVNDTSLTASYSVAAAGAVTSVNEGSSLTFNVSGSNIVDGTYYWTINNTTTSVADFSVSSGSFTITSNSGSFIVTPLADFTTEGAETFTVSVRTVSVSGTVVATSSSITVNDTSLADVLFAIVPVATSSGATAPSQYKFFNYSSNAIDYTCSSGFAGTIPGSGIGVMRFGNFILEWSRGPGASTYYVYNFTTNTQISTSTFANVGASRNYDVIKFQSDKFGILYKNGTSLFMDTYSFNTTTGAITAITTINYGVIALTGATGFEGGDYSPQGAASVTLTTSTMAISSFSGYFAFTAVYQGSPNYYGTFGTATINSAGTSGAIVNLTTNTTNFARPQGISGASGKIYISQFDGGIMRIANASGGWDTSTVSGSPTNNIARVPAPILGTDNFMDVDHTGGTTTLQTSIITSASITNSTAFTTSFTGSAGSMPFCCIMQGAPNGCIFFFNDGSSILRYVKYNSSTGWGTAASPTNLTSSTLTINYNHGICKIINW